MRQIITLLVLVAALTAAESIPAGNADLDALLAEVRRKEAIKNDKDEEARVARARVAAADAAVAAEAASRTRRQQIEAEAAAEVRRQAEAQGASDAAQDLADLPVRERAALAERLANDASKYRAIEASEFAKDLTPVAWARLCAMYNVKDIRQGDVEQLTEMILPGSRALAEKSAAVAADAGLSRVPTWAQQMGQDSQGSWATLVVGGQIQVMRLIRAGSFMMGNDLGLLDERPKHLVTISQPFWLGECEVTQGLWQAVTGANPSLGAPDPRRPVDQVSWDDCQGFLRLLNNRVIGLSACLPTEAQWEYACRAGSNGDFAVPVSQPFGTLKEHPDLSAVAWYDKNADDQPHRVKAKAVNPWGLYDMYGNVFEWCTDWHDIYKDGVQRDPTGPTKPANGDRRIIRGGCYWISAGFVRPSWRGVENQTSRHRGIGFRLATQVTP